MFFVDNMGIVSAIMNGIYVFDRNRFLLTIIITPFLFMNFKKSLAKISAVLLIAIIMPMASVFAQTWTPPNVAPPGGNVPAPINVGATAQTRAGGLTISDFLTVGNLLTAGSLLSNPAAPAFIANGTSALKYFTQIGEGMQGNGLALDVTGVNNNILSSFFNAIYTGIIRVESLSHTPTANEPVAVCATPDGDLVLCGTTPPGTSLSFNASPSQVNPSTGGNSTLSWNTTGFSSCSAAANNFGFATSGNTNGTDQVTGISAATTFTLNCVTATGVAQSATTSVGIVSGPVDPDAVINFFTATPSSIYSGSTVMLAWDTDGYSTCAAATNNVGFSTSGNTNGTDPTTAITVSSTITKTFTLNCTTASGTINSATASVVVNAVGTPTVNLTSSNSTVSLGQNYVLTWDSSNIRPSGGLSTPQCVATSTNQPNTNWTGYKLGTVGPVDGGYSATVTTTAVGTYVHTITCYGVTGASVTDSVTVTVTPAAAPLFTINATNNISSVAAKTHGQINANGTNIVGGSEKIYYCKSSATCTAQTMPANLTGYTLSTFSGIILDYFYNLASLSPSSAYYFKYCVTYNTNQTACSGINTFTTLAAGTPGVTLSYKTGNGNFVAVQGDTKSLSTQNQSFSLQYQSSNATHCQLYDTTGNPQSGWDSNGWNTANNTTAITAGPLTLPANMNSATYTINCVVKNAQGNIVGPQATNFVTVQYTLPVSTSLHYKAPGANSFTLLSTTPMTAGVNSQNAQFYIGTSNNNATTCRKVSTPSVPGWATTWNANDALSNTTPTSPALTLNGNPSVTFTYECKNNLNVISSRVLTVNYVPPVSITSVTAAPIGSASATITANIAGASSGYVQYAATAGGVTAATHQAGTLSGQNFSRALTSLSSGTAYYYRVCGVSGATTICSPVSPFTTKTPSLKINNQTSTTLAPIVLSNIASYNIEWSDIPTSSCAAVTVAQYPNPNGSPTLVAFAPNSSYTWQASNIGTSGTLTKTLISTMPPSTVVNYSIQCNGATVASAFVKFIPAASFVNSVVKTLPVFNCPTGTANGVYPADSLCVSLSDFNQWGYISNSAYIAPIAKYTSDCKYQFSGNATNSFSGLNNMVSPANQDASFTTNYQYGAPLGFGYSGFRLTQDSNGGSNAYMTVRFTCTPMQHTASAVPIIKEYTIKPYIPPVSISPASSVISGQPSGTLNSCTAGNGFFKTMNFVIDPNNIDTRLKTNTSVQSVNWYFKTYTDNGVITPTSLSNSVGAAVNTVGTGQTTLATGVTGFNTKALLYQGFVPSVTNRTYINVKYQIMINGNPVGFATGSSGYFAPKNDSSIANFTANVFAAQNPITCTTTP